MWVTKINLGGFSGVFLETLYHAEFLDLTSFTDLTKILDWEISVGVPHPSPIFLTIGIISYQ